MENQNIRDDFFNKGFNNFSLHEIVNDSIQSLKLASMNDDSIFSDFLRATIYNKRLRESNTYKPSPFLYFDLSKHLQTAKDNSDKNLIAVAIRSGACAAHQQKYQSNKVFKAGIDQLFEMLSLDISNPDYYRLALFEKAFGLVKMEKPSGLDREVYISLKTAIINEKINLNILDYSEMLSETNNLIGEMENYLILHFYKAYNTYRYYKKGQPGLDLDTVVSNYFNTVQVAAKLSGLNLENDVNSWIYKAPCTSGFAIALEKFQAAKNLKNKITSNLLSRPFSYNVLGGSLINVVK